MSNTTTQASATEPKIYSKTISDEQATLVRHMPLGMSQVSLLGNTYDDSAFWIIRNPHTNIEDEEFWVGIRQGELEREQEYLENMESHLAYYLEEDEDSKVFNGKFYPSHSYTEMKKEQARNRRNTQARIYRLKAKLAYNNRKIVAQKVFIPFWDSLPAKEGIGY